MVSCTTNEPCSQGYCCESNISSSRYQTCTFHPLSCYTQDSTNDKFEHCTGNYECATTCCHKDYEQCWAT